MLNIVIPMAGLGSRFIEAGYTDPKPFIDICGTPMIRRVMSNLRVDDARFILLARKEHLSGYEHVITSLQTDFCCEVQFVPKLTEGAACTILLIASQLNNDTPLLVANCDQIVDIDIKSFITDATDRELDGSILTFLDPTLNTKWSYAKLDNNQHVINVREKVAISDIATVGIYYFNKGSDYVANAAEMIANIDKSNGEYYLCPVYNYLIKNDKTIGIYNIDSAQMHGTGTPEDLIEYQKLIS